MTLLHLIMALSNLVMALKGSGVTMNDLIVPLSNPMMAEWDFNSPAPKQKSTKQTPQIETDFYFFISKQTMYATQSQQSCRPYEAL
jgi:hypothetical protein